MDEIEVVIDADQVGRTRTRIVVDSGNRLPEVRVLYASFPPPGLRTRRSTRGDADEAELVPHQPGLTTEGRKVHQLDQGPFLHPAYRAAATTTALFAPRLEVNSKRSVDLIDHPEHDQ